jgi:hypothetical protein
MQRFDDSVFEVAGEDKSTVITELFDKPTESRLSTISVKIISFI